MDDSTPSPTAAVPPQEKTATGEKEASRFSPRNLLALFILVLLAAGLYSAYLLLKPFANTLVLAVVFAALFAPVYSWFLARFKGRKSLAALLVLLFVVIGVIVPLTMLIAGLIPQMRQSVTAIIGWVGGGHLDTFFTNHLNHLFDWVHDKAPFLGITAESVKADILESVRHLGQSILGFSANFVGRTLTLLLHFFLFLVALFFFLKDGTAMIARLKYLTPLREDQQERIIDTLRRVSRSVLAGGFMVAALQGLAGGIGLALVGIPALFWGTVMALSAFVPVLGTGLVWVPAVLFLLLIGSWKSAIFLGLWCGIFVTSIDTFLRPYLMRDASGLPVLFLFLAILGGIQAFGIFGLLYGPVILTFAVVMLRIYADEYQGQLRSKNAWARNCD